MPPHLTSQELTAYGTGRLPDEENRRVEEHLLACQECQDEFQKMAEQLKTTCQLTAAANEFLSKIKILPAPAPEIAGEHGNGQYKLVRRLGRGGMGKVWEAYETNKSPNYRFALKIFSSNDFLKLEQRNIGLIRAINHPLIGAVLNVDERHRCILMELFEGLTLRERLERCGRIESPFELLRIANDILEAMFHVHSLHVQHKDIKPSNIALTPRNGNPERAILFDFGVSTAEGDPYTHGATPGVLPPESQRVDESIENKRRSDDVYSVGRVIYEMLHGVDDKNCVTVDELRRSPNKDVRYLEIAELVPWLCRVGREFEPKSILDRLAEVRAALVGKIPRIAKTAINVCRDVAFQLENTLEYRSFAVTRDNLRTGGVERARLLNAISVKKPQEPPELSERIGELLFALTAGDLPAKSPAGDRNLGEFKYAQKESLPLPSEFLRVVESLCAPNPHLRPQSLPEIDDCLYRLSCLL